MTVIATALTDTGSRMNDVICEEFKGKANSEIVLSEELAELHVYPAMDVAHTSTRREDDLVDADELTKIRKLRRELRSKSAEDSLEHVMTLLRDTEGNAELLEKL